MNAYAGENARRFHDHRAAGAIVGRAVAGDPAVQVRTSHDIARMRIFTGYVGEGIVGVVIRVLEMDSAVEFQPYFAAFREARQLSVVLRREFETRKLWRLTDAITVAF